MNDGSYRDWRAGDVYLAYPDGSPSWRFVEIRNGIATAEEVRILEKDAAFDDDLAKLRTRYDYKGRWPTRRTSASSSSIR